MEFKKIYVGHLFSILIENLGSVTKTEWKKCPISQFLGLDFELFQIKQVCAKKIENNPRTHLVSKVAFYDMYDQYKLCF